MLSFERIRAFGVHVFTACGAALAMLALIMATEGLWSAMFFCLGLALLVDGVDGTMARALRVSEVLPRWNGDVLDNVVDFTTYVFVPAFAIGASGLMPEAYALAAVVLIVVTGALYFADREMKTQSHYFKGFPVVWNLAAFYLFLLQPPPWAAASAIAALVVLTFAPVRFVHPLRVKRLRILNIALLGAWAALAAMAVVSDLTPGPYVTIPLTAIAVYFLGAGLIREAA